MSTLQRAMQESQAERYSMLMDAFKEIIENGVSEKTLKTLMFETGVNQKDVEEVSKNIFMEWIKQ
jgi:predicted transcriptional regulator